MSHLLLYLPVLVCPVGMGLMMLVMMRMGMNRRPPEPSAPDVTLARPADPVPGYAEIDAPPTAVRDQATVR